MKQLLIAAICLFVLASVSSTELGHRSGDDDDPTSINAVLTSVVHQLAELQQTVTRLVQDVDNLKTRDVEVSD